jgi:hypothetical protein
MIGGGFEGGWILSDVIFTGGCPVLIKSLPIFFLIM